MSPKKDEMIRRTVEVKYLDRIVFPMLTTKDTKEITPYLDVIVEVKTNE